MALQIKRMDRAGELFSVGLSTVAIGKVMNLPESVVVKLLDADRCYRRGLPLPEYEARK